MRMPIPDISTFNVLYYELFEIIEEDKEKRNS